MPIGIKNINMKFYLTLLVFTVLMSQYELGYSQILHPVHWSYAAKKTGKNTAIIYLKAIMDDGWHIYSINEKDGDGPVKTSFKFTPSESYRLADNISEPTPITKYESAFKMN